MLRSVRLLLVAWEVSLVVGALAVLWSGFAWAPLVLVYALINAGLIAIVLVRERPRYHSETEVADARSFPSGEQLPPGQEPTDELFIDPTSGVRVRVWANAATGERRYRREPSRAAGNEQGEKGVEAGRDRRPAGVDGAPGGSPGKR